MNDIHRGLRAILLSAAFVSGVVGVEVVSAQSNPSVPSTETQTETMRLTGSIPVPKGTTSYRDMARVSLADAVAAAQQATGDSGSPTSVELGVENGYLVWTVEFMDREIVVDAGDGQVLQDLQGEGSNDDDSDAEMDDAQGHADDESEPNAAGGDEDEAGGDDGGEYDVHDD